MATMIMTTNVKKSSVNYDLIKKITEFLLILNQLKYNNGGGR